MAEFRRLCSPERDRERKVESGFLDAPDQGSAWLIGAGLVRRVWTTLGSAALRRVADFTSGVAFRPDHSSSNSLSPSRAG